MQTFPAKLWAPGEAGSELKISAMSPIITEPEQVRKH